MANTTTRKPPAELMPDRIERVNKNIDLAFEFLRDEETMFEPPKGSTLVLLPDDDPEQTAANIRIGLRAIERGENVYFRHVHRQEK